jgi:hypothetical protein
MMACESNVAECANHKHGSAHEVASCELQQVKRPIVSPVQVVEEQDDWFRAGGARHEQGYGLK